MLVVLTVELLAYPHVGHVPTTFILYVPALAYVCVGNDVVTVCSAESSPQFTVIFKPVPCTGSFIVVFADGIVHSVIIYGSMPITSNIRGALITSSVTVLVPFVKVLVNIYSIVYLPATVVFTSPLIVTLYPHFV